MKRIVTFTTEYDAPNPPEIGGNEMFRFKTNEQNYIKVGVTEDADFGITEFTTMEELVDWVNEQRLKNVQRQIDAGWTPPEGYAPPGKSTIVEVVQPVWEAVHGA